MLLTEIYEIKVEKHVQKKSLTKGESLTQEFETHTNNKNLLKKEAKWENIY